MFVLEFRKKIKYLTLLVLAFCIGLLISDTTQSEFLAGTPIAEADVVAAPGGGDGCDAGCSGAGSGGDGGDG